MKLKLKFVSYHIKGGAFVAQNYKTRQRAVIEQLLKEKAGEHLTADDIALILSRRGYSVGKATVYRCLDRMMEQGCVKKYSFGEGESARYEYHADAQPLRYHLRCSHCGELLHLECRELDKLPQHIFEHHGFTLDVSQLVLVGCCEKCGSKRSGV